MESMRERQETSLTWEARPGPFEHALDGRVRALGERGGLLRVLEGSVWVTVEAVGDDSVLVAGDRVLLPAGHGAWIEPWEPGRRVRIDWRPQRRGEALAERVALVARALRARWRAVTAALAAWTSPRIPGHADAARPRAVACQAGRGPAGAA